MLNPEKKVAIGFAASVLVLVAVCTVSLWLAHRSTASFRALDHTHAVLRAIERAQFDVIELQSEARAFSLDSDSARFERVRSLSGDVFESLAQARGLTVDNPVQQHRLDLAEPLAHHLLDPVAALPSPPAAPADLVGLLDETAVDRLGDFILAIEAHERGLLDERSASSRLFNRASVTLIVALGLISGSVVIGAAVVSRRDFRRRRAAEREIERAAARIHDLYNRAPCGYHSLDGDGVFIEINDTELAWLGRTRESVIGRLAFADIATPGSAALFRELFPLFRRQGVIENQEFELLRADGSRFNVLLNATAIYDTDGRYLASRSTLYDISRRRAAEQRIHELNSSLRLQNTRLAAVNEELESFSYSVSHDLRAPLRHIDGFAALLQKRAASALDDTGRRHLTVISEAARQMGRLIDDLLAFSRMGRTELQAADFDHDTLVASIIRDERLHKAAARVTWDVGPLPSVHADAAMLRQVWFNLIDNAVKYSSKTPEPRVSIRAASTDAEYEFRIADNGVGFDMRYIDKLFGVFQRLHPASEFEGTGIGLANVRRVIARHGGRTWAESRPGAGATFFFTLPRLSPTSPL